jgi:uncharacterized protein (TIGR02145 family)
MTTTTIGVHVVAIALGFAFGTIAGAGPSDRISSRQMADGKQWTIDNLNVETSESYCYEGTERNCHRYGRLYTWGSAKRGCESLGAGWRLPTEDEWRRLAKHYGGLREESEDSGKAAYTALSIGGHSGFNALLGGGRGSDDGQYARLEAHGFYWTASETDRDSAWFYNFGRGGQSLNRHRDGKKHMAISVRCIRE